MRAVAARALPGGLRRSRRRCRSGSRPSGCSSSSSRPATSRTRRSSRGSRRSASAPRTRSAPSARGASLELELERTRALLAVVGQATAELSLAHTLETAVERVAALLGVERVALYLRAEEDRLVAGRGARPRGPARARRGAPARAGARACAQPRRRRWSPTPRATSGSRDVRDAAREAGIGAALAAPLLVRDEVVGLLAVYPERGRLPAENEAALLAALAGQLAVAVQNAQLHERATELEPAARGSARVRARRGAPPARALRDLALVRAGALARQDARGARDDGRRRARRRRGGDRDAGRAARAASRRARSTCKDPQLADAARAILFRPRAVRRGGVQRLFRDATPYRLAARARACSSRSSRRAGRRPSFPSRRRPRRSPR